MTEDEAKVAIRARRPDEIPGIMSSTRVETILQVLEADPHAFSERPCSTCESVSALLGRAFGCVAARRKAGAQRSG